MKKFIIIFLTLPLFTSAQKVFYGQWQFDSLYAALSAKTDTTTYKPVVMGATNQFHKLPYWPAGTGGVGTNYWTATGNDIYNNNSRNVGIGTSAPSAKFHLRDTASSMIVESTSNTGYSVTNFLNDTSSLAASIGFGNALAPAGVAQRNMFLGPRKDYSNLLFVRKGVGTFDMLESARFDASGRFGINKSNPTRTLDVTGTGAVSTSFETPLLLVKGATTGDIEFEKTGTTQKAYLAYNGSTASLSTNRNISGTFSNTGMASAAVNLYSQSGLSQIDFYTSNANNTAPPVRLTIGSTGSIIFPAVNTATGTTGARTINTPSGKVNFAAAATTLVVTNALVTTASVVMLTVEGTDATATSARATLAAGSFTITLNAAATAETKVSFFVIN